MAAPRRSRCRRSAGDRRATTGARSKAVGTDLFGPGLFPFEAISILLLVAVVGAIAIARPLHEDEPTTTRASADGREVAAMSDILFNVGYGHFLVLAAVLFLIGVGGVLVRRNALIILMSVELMLNAANMTLLTFSRMWGDLLGRTRSR